MNFTSVTNSGARQGVVGSTISRTAYPDHGFQVEVEYKLPGKEGEDSGRSTETIPGTGIEIRRLGQLDFGRNEDGGSLCSSIKHHVLLLPTWEGFFQDGRVHVSAEQ